MPFDGPITPRDDHERREWIEAQTAALLANPAFKRLIERACEAIANGEFEASP